MSADIFKKLIAQESLKFTTSILLDNDDWKRNLGRLMAIAFALTYKHPHLIEGDEMLHHGQGVFDEMIEDDLLTEADVLNLLSEAAAFDDDVPLGV